MTRESPSSTAQRRDGPVERISSIRSIPKTHADHVAFARDFLQPLGATLWKVNMGQRPAPAPSDDQLKRLAKYANEIGRQTITMGIRLAPHPHIWGPLEREREVRRAMELTDPKYVWLTAEPGT